MNRNKQLIWREVKIVSDSTQAVCEHYRGGATRCFIQGRNGGKSIDLEAFRQTQPSNPEKNNYWFREVYELDGSSTVEYITENTPESFFSKEGRLDPNQKNNVPPFEQPNKKTNWWKWFLIIWALAAIGRVLSPSSGLNKKIHEAEKEADSTLQLK